MLERFPPKGVGMLRMSSGVWFDTSEEDKIRPILRGGLTYPKFFGVWEVVEPWK